MRGIQNISHYLSSGTIKGLNVFMQAWMALIKGGYFLIDEIENAGIDKERALGLLQKKDKLVLVVTHDPHTALMAQRRIVLSGGAVATCR